MGISPEHLKKYVIVPTLEAMGANSESAVAMLMGTAAQESLMGYYLHQKRGPALGIYQPEPDTYYDIFNNYLSHKTLLKRNLYRLINWHEDYEPPKELLITNLSFATAIARIHYMRVPEALPQPTDISGLAAYWKRYYNTSEGRGTTDEFIENYNRTYS